MNRRSFLKQGGLALSGSLAYSQIVSGEEGCNKAEIRETDEPLKKRAYLPAVEDALYEDSVEATVYTTYFGDEPVYRDNEEDKEESRDTPCELTAYIEERFQDDLDISLDIDWQEKYVSPETVAVTDEELMEDYGKSAEQFVEDYEAFITQTPFSAAGWGPTWLPDDLGKLAEMDATLYRLHQDFDEFTIMPYVNYLVEDEVSDEGITIIAADFQSEGDTLGYTDPTSGTAYLNTGLIDDKSEFFLEEVTAHELAHIFGIEHVASCGDLMHPNVAGDRFTAPSQEGWEDAKKEYRENYDD